MTVDTTIDAGNAHDKEMWNIPGQTCTMGVLAHAAADHRKILG